MLHNSRLALIRHARIGQETLEPMVKGSSRQAVDNNLNYQTGTAGNWFAMSQDYSTDLCAPRRPMFGALCRAS